MIITGAGGHVSEIKEELEKLHPKIEFRFFDDAGYKTESTLKDYPLIQDLNLSKLKFDQKAQFALGVGKPDFRGKFMIAFEQIGGEYFPIEAGIAEVNPSAAGLFDAMSFPFVGPNSKLGKSVLVNSRANIHLEAEIGDYTDIGPGAVLLSVVELGDQVVIGAGAVVTKNVNDNQTMIGIPATPFNK